eukprot:TRINITY_DN9604_c0_g2_i1.p1 TRINITY_DN9604_c0_g2~~TRINITY_DN9604_c0_g2_i1.p1  ORF type:complete len:359 (-),score=106.65 TRINITY_DN9604_c0_g2_i1:245-1321(-)
MNEELETELARVPLKVDEAPLELQERKLDSAIECAYTEEKVLLREKNALKEKLKVDASYDRVVTLEKELRAKLERNKKMGKLVKRQERGVNRKDKKYCSVKEEIDNAKPNQIEEERLLRHINKERERQKEQEEEIKQNFKSIQTKTERQQEMEERVQWEERELEDLKKEYYLQEENKKLNDPYDEFRDLKGPELKALLVKVQSERKAEKKTMAEEKAEQQAQLDALKESFNEISRQKNINGHRLQELTRLARINANKDKTKSGRNTDLTTNELTTKSQRVKSYQAKLRNELTCTVATKGSKTNKVHIARKSVANDNDLLKVNVLKGKPRTRLSRFSKATKEIETQTVGVPLESENALC